MNVTVHFQSRTSWSVVPQHAAVPQPWGWAPTLSARAQRRGCSAGEQPGYGCEDTGNGSELQHQQPQVFCQPNSQPQQQQQQQHEQRKQQQQQKQQEHKQFQQVLEDLQQQSYTDLQQLLEDHPEHRAFSASFLFWLSAEEKRATGQHKQHLTQLAAQLVYLKEQADYEASRRMLPPLASSLAYSNYSQWRTSHSEEDLPEVTPGVSLTDLYKAAEREEAKLKQWQSPQRPSSTLDNFAAASGYGGFAAEAMARVQARLAGFEDDATLQRLRQLQQAEESTAAGHDAEPVQEQPGNPAAERVLDELLVGCCCREERATLLPEACMPPGLEVSAVGRVSSSGSARARVLTSPQHLLTAVSARIQLQQSQQQSQQQVDQGLLPSGESLLQALKELQEDLQEYDKHIYSRMSHRDMHGL